MPSRYKHTKMTKNKEGRRVFRPTMYPSIPVRDSDIYINPKDMERCEHVAHRFYGDQSLWWVIAQANNIHNGSIYLDSEKQIRVPQDIKSIMMDLESENKLF